MKRPLGKQENRVNCVKFCHEKTITLYDLSEYELLNIFKHCVNGALFNEPGRVCKKWHEIINDGNNQKTILFRAVMHCSIEKELGKENLRLARKMCEYIYTKNKDIAKEDVEYFINLDQQIIEKTAKNDEMFKKILYVMGMGHPQCAEVLKKFLSAQQVDNSDLERLESHIGVIIRNMFDFVKNEKLDQGYGLIIPLMLERIMPLLRNGAKPLIVGALKNFYADDAEIPLRIMKEEAGEFYKMLIKLNVEGGDETFQKSKNIFVGCMAIRLSCRNSWHHEAFWELFFSQTFSQLRPNEYKDMNYIASKISELLESKNSSLILYCSQNVCKFITFLENLLFNQNTSFKYSILCNLNLIYSSPYLMIDENEKRRMVLIFYEYFNSKFIGNGIMDLTKSLIIPEHIDENIISKLILKIPDKLVSEEDLEIFISRIPEQLIKNLTEIKRSEIIKLFRSNINSRFFEFIEEGFNVYLDFFSKLYLDSSLKVKMEIVLLVGELVLNCSQIHSHRAWETFFELVYSNAKMLTHINRATSVAEGALGIKKMNFSQKIRDSLNEKKSDFIDCFNENIEKFLEFLKSQFLGIRKISVKVEVVLTLIYVSVNRDVKTDNHKYRTVIVDWLNNELQGNFTLKKDVNIRINQIAKICDKEELTKFLNLKERLMLDKQ